MSKLFRVFFSSTFSDFVEERNALNNNVFPRLKELCAANGARFQPIDLRWGIPDEAALQQSTMQICLKEIKQCQNITPRPNFIIFLGEKYGWTPPPPKITKTEFDMISNHFNEEDKSFIEKWYKLDENELYRLDNGIITAVYEIQPRVDKYENYQIWEPIEIKLRNTLLAAARKSQLSEKEMVKYFASVTHQEIVTGALETLNAEKHVHSFFREINKLPKGDLHKIYFESEPEKQKYLSSLKLELAQRLPSNIYRYSVDMGKRKHKQDYLDNFCKDVFDVLSSIILKELEIMVGTSALEEEIDSHIEFGKNVTRVFVGREKNLNEIINYIKFDNRIPFIIKGDPGSGKTALIAKIYERLEEENIAGSHIIRFIGTTPSSSDSIGLIRNMCEQFINKYEIKIEEEIPFEYPKLNEVFWKIISLIKERIIILVDGLDQLSKTDKGRDFGWIPQELPENVRLITSFASDDHDIIKTIEKKFPNSLHQLKRLSLDEGEKALDILLENSLRRLTPDQRNIVLKKISENGLPLYLKLLFEEACTWNSYSDISSIKLAANVEGLIKILFERLYKDHTKKTVDKVLSYIAASRNGLTEDEILEVLTSDHEYFRWYKTEQIHHDLPEEKIPWIVWSRLFSDLEPYLTTRGVDHTSTISFFHRQFKETIEKDLLSKDADNIYRILANYFNTAHLYYQINGKKTPNYRKLSELVYNLRKAKLWKIAEKILSSLEYIEAKCTAVMTEDLLIDYKSFLDDMTSKALLDEYGKVVKNFKHFVFNQVHILRRYPHLTVQQALNQPDNTIPSQFGRNYLKNTDSSRSWMEWINKPQVQDPCILTLTGHSNWVRGCAFSPDGNLLISASFDNALKLWDVETGTEIRTFTEPSDSVWAGAFTPDGKSVVSASWDGILKIWDVETGVEIRTFEKHSGAIYECAFSPDGKMLVSASDDKNLKLWNVETGTAIKILRGHLEEVWRCAFSPDSTKILSASNDGTLRLWDAGTGKEIRTFTGHAREVQGCAFSPDGNQILSASYDSTLKLWDVETGAEIRTFAGHTDLVSGCAFSPDGKRIASASNDKTLKLWDVDTGAEIRTFTGHSDPLLDCAFSPDGRMVVSASWDGTLKLWVVDPSDNIRTLTRHSDSILGCAISHNDKRLVSASADKTLKLWDIKTGVEIRTFIGHSAPVMGCTFSNDERKLVSASFDKTLILWDVETGVEIRTFKGHSEEVKECAISPDNKKIVSASVDGTLRIWNLENGTEIKILTGHTEEVEGCAFSPDGTKIMSASADKTLKLWDAKNGTKLITLTGHSEEVEGCAFSPNGMMGISASRDKTLKIWDLKTGTEIKTFTGHSDKIWACTFTLDGNMVVSASDDGTLRLWDINTGNEINLFPTLGKAFSVAVGANGLIAAGDSSGHIYILRSHGIDSK